MAWVQNVKPPANVTQSFSLRDFSGGLNNRSDLIEDNNQVNVLNMIYADDALLETRQGQDYLDETEYEKAISFLDTFEPYTGDVQKIEATVDGVYANGSLIKAVEGDIHGITHEGKYYFVDGKNIYVYGKFPMVTSVYVEVIGTPADEFRVMKVVNPTVGYTPLGTEHVEGKTVYNYTINEVEYQPCTNEMTDPFKGANVIPENIKYLVSHKGRLFVSGNYDDDDNVFIGDERSSFYFPVYLPIQVPPDSDRIKGLIVYDDDVVIGRHRDIYAISGTTNRPDTGLEVFNLRKINTHTGVANADAMSVVNNYLFFLGSDGVPYAIDATRGDTKVVRSVIIGKTIDVFKEPIGWDDEKIQTTKAIYYKDMWYLACDGKVLIYSYRKQSWLLYDRVYVNCFDVRDNDLIWGDYDGRLAHFYEGYLDFGEPYPSFFHTKLFNMGDANSFKQFKEMFIVARAFEEYNSDINVKVEIDYADVRDSVTIENNISIWGISKFGDRFINRLITDSYPIIIGRRGRNIRFKIHNRFYKDGEVDLIDDLEYYIGRIEGVVVYVLEDESYYKYTNREWVKLEQRDIEQRMKIYEINGYYEMRGRR